MQNLDWKTLLEKEYENNNLLSPIDFVTRHYDLIDGSTREAKRKKVSRAVCSLRGSDPLGINKNPSRKEVTQIDYATGVTSSEKVISLDSYEVNDPKALLKAHGFNPDKFILLNAKNSKWEQNSKADGTLTLYSSKIEVKPVHLFAEEYSDLTKYFETFTSPIKEDTYKINKESSNDILVLPMYDFHWGRLPYNNKGNFSIYEYGDEILYNIESYLYKFCHHRFKEIILVVGQDYFNSAYNGYTSSQSHIQDNAVDPHTMYQTGTELMINIINLFAKRGEPITVLGSLGNHSREEEAWMLTCLKYYYKDSNIVIVDDEYAQRKYRLLGNTCVGFGHLDKEKDRIYGIMQCEVPELWSKSNHRMFIAGHLHQFFVESKNGVELWRIPSPTPLDKWTHEQGYTMNKQRTMAFIFDDVDGLKETHFINF